ncbi:uncharacterized protein LOC144366940 [Ictidomys tridecemlineatus]
MPPALSTLRGGAFRCSSVERGRKDDRWDNGLKPTGIGLAARGTWPCPRLPQRSRCTQQFQRTQPPGGGIHSLCPELAYVPTKPPEPTPQQLWLHPQAPPQHPPPHLALTCSAFPVAKEKGVAQEPSPRGAAKTGIPHPSQSARRQEGGPMPTHLSCGPVFSSGSSGVHTRCHSVSVSPQTNPAGSRPAATANRACASGVQRRGGRGPRRARSSPAAGRSTAAGPEPAGQRVPPGSRRAAPRPRILSAGISGQTVLQQDGEDHMPIGQNLSVT